MKSFWSYVSNGRYSVGCSGASVWLYNSTGAQLARFQDIRYASSAAFSPVEDIFVVKSTGAYFAVYSAPAAALLHKVKYSGVDASQDDGFCFSPNGRYFINIERQKTSFHSCISVYETGGWGRIAQMYADDDRLEPKWVEFGSDGLPYVLGFTRGEDRVMDGCFAARLGHAGLEEMRPLAAKEYDFYIGFKTLEQSGFTEKAKRTWAVFPALKTMDPDALKQQKYPLKELWKSLA